MKCVIFWHKFVSLFKSTLPIILTHSILKRIPDYVYYYSVFFFNDGRISLVSILTHSQVPKKKLLFKIEILILFLIYKI